MQKKLSNIELTKLGWLRQALDLTALTCEHLTPRMINFLYHIVKEILKEARMTGILETSLPHTYFRSEFGCSHATSSRTVTALQERGLIKIRRRNIWDETKAEANLYRLPDHLASKLSATIEKEGQDNGGAIFA